MSTTTDDPLASLTDIANPTPAQLRAAAIEMIETSADPDAAFEDFTKRHELHRYGSVHSNSRHLSWAFYFGTPPRRLVAVYAVIAMIADSEDRGATLDDLTECAGVSENRARQLAAELCELGLTRWDPDGLTIVCPVTRGTF